MSKQSQLRKFITITGLLSSMMMFPAITFGECGIASHYSSGYQTANGERYNHLGISAAHKTLPFGTRVIVRNQRTGNSILVRINDRGPFVPGRIIDLSTGAKRALRMDGLAPVCLHVVSYGDNKRYRSEYYRNINIHSRHHIKHHHHSKYHKKHHRYHKHHHIKRVYREDQA